MMTYLGIDIQAYKWTPYPSITLIVQNTFTLRVDEIETLSKMDRVKINTNKIIYLRKLISHRINLASNYKFLVEIWEQFERCENKKGLEEIKKLCQDHELQESKSNYLHTNRTFKSLRYTELKNHISSLVRRTSKT